MTRSEEYAREIAAIDDRLAQLPPEESDERADLLARRQELTADAAEDLGGEQPPVRAVEPQPEPDEQLSDREIEAGG